MAQSCPTLHLGPPCPSPSPGFAQVHVHCISDVIQPSHPLMPFSPSVFSLSQNHWVFSNELAVLIRWPKYWSFSSALVLPMSEYSGLISFRTDWFDLLAVKGTHKSLLQTPQFKGINSSVLCIRYCTALTTTHDYWKYYCAELTYLQWLCQSEVLGKGWQIRSAKYAFNQLIMSTHALDWKEFWSHVQVLQEKCLWSIS